MKKTIVITGAAGNLAKACVEKFLAEGYYIIATVRNREEADVHRGKENMETHIVDATDEKAAQAFAESTIAKHGTINASLQLIGGFASGDITVTDGQLIQKMLTLNFSTAYFMSRPLFRQMLTQTGGGRMIFMAAAPALTDAGGYGNLAYVLSKTLVLRLAKMLNAEGQKKNVHCAVIAPTTIDTPQNRKDLPDADFSQWTQPEDIANMMAYFCSEKGDKMKDVVIKM